jgi:uroporphyrin-III C-methyltransferase
MTPTRTAVVLAAHGSRSDPSVQERYEALAARLQARGVAEEVVVAFHAIAPGLDASLDRVAAERIAVVPMLTSDGYFNRVVLPAALQRNVRAAQPGWRIAAPVGTHPAWVRVFAAQVRSMIAAHSFDVASIELVVVGHGTTRESSSQTSAATLAAGLSAALGVPAQAFYLDASPMLETVWATTSRAHLIVVPFLFGGGHLTGDIPERIGVHASRASTVLSGLLDSDALDDIVAERAAEALRAVGSVTLVGAGPGDPELITVRGLAALRAADVVVYDRLIADALLAEARHDAILIDVGKRAGDESAAQERINAVLVEQALAGHHVVRLKGGDSFVFGRGSEEIDACVDAGVPCSVVPGVSSAIAAPESAGIPVTERSVARSFAVITARTADESLEKGTALASVAQADTIVVMMGSTAIATIAVQLMGLGRAPETAVAIVSRGTMPDQRVLRSTLREIGEAAATAALPSPLVLIIGAVTRRALATVAS